MPFLNVAAAICFVGFVASMLVFCYAHVVQWKRTRQPGDVDIERGWMGSTWIERLLLHKVRFLEFLVDDDHRSLRKLYFSALASMIGSFAPVFAVGIFVEADYVNLSTSRIAE
jgi:hypothetical protein